MKISKQMEAFCQEMANTTGEYGEKAQRAYMKVYNIENMGWEAIFHKSAHIGMHEGVRARMIELGVEGVE